MRCLFVSHFHLLASSVSALRGRKGDLSLVVCLSLTCQLGPRVVDMLLKKCEFPGGTKCEIKVAIETGHTIFIDFV